MREWLEAGTAGIAPEGAQLDGVHNLLRTFVLDYLRHDKFDCLRE